MFKTSSVIDLPIGLDSAQVEYIFTTELVNKAAAAVSRGEVETIVEFHKKHHNPLNHLELSTERGQNLMKNHKSYGKSGQRVNMTSIMGQIQLKV